MLMLDVLTLHVVYHYYGSVVYLNTLSAICDRRSNRRISGFAVGSAAIYGQRPDFIQRLNSPLPGPYYPLNVRYINVEPFFHTHRDRRLRYVSYKVPTCAECR